MSRREWSRALIDEEEKAQVATDLLMVLQKIPIQVIGEFDGCVCAKGMH